MSVHELHPGDLDKVLAIASQGGFVHACDHHGRTACGARVHTAVKPSVVAKGAVSCLNCRKALGEEDG